MFVKYYLYSSLSKEKKQWNWPPSTDLLLLPISSVLNELNLSCISFYTATNCLVKIWSM